MHASRPASLFVLILVSVSGCTHSKSDNPVSPSIAGPIAGVSITAPQPALPAVGASVPRSAQPIALTVENASTNGERPLLYTFEGSPDAGFGTEVFRQTAVSPGANGRTSVQVPTTLQAGRTYHWRAQAYDGANTGPYSATANFTVIDPFTLLAPSPIAPVEGAVTSAQPTLRISNAPQSGEPEPVFYDFEVASADQFNSPVAWAYVPEGGVETAWSVPSLAAGRTYYWRVRARSASTFSPWIATRTFRTEATASAPAPTPPPSPGLPPSNPGPRPRPSEGAAMVEAVIADMKARGISMAGDCGGFEITRRVAWAFRNRGAGLERKPGGRNCQGHSIDIIIFTDGQTVDMLIGAGADNGATWQEHGVLSDWADWWIAPTNPG